MTVGLDSKVKRIAFIGNYLPRQCGIATFTTDLVESICKENPELDVIALAMNDIKEGYSYPDRVRFQLDQQDLVSYQTAGDFINLNNYDMVCLQHEYGIFGGDAGNYILTLLHQLEVPVVTTLHTVLRNPDPEQLRVMKELVQLSDRLVVMSQRGVEYLQEVYGVSNAKIDLIPHGIPDVSFVDPNFFKDKFKVEGRPVLLTFGLLSPNKGIENVIAALPAVKEKFPNIAYLSVGATHPHVLRSEGEKYRNSLQKLVEELGLEENVIFHDRFVSIDELLEFIGAADIYITPYLNRDQITSGTLAYTVGAGKAVISTPYWYAEELLSQGRGILVPFKDPQAIAREINYLLENESERHAIRKRAYMYGRTMIWTEVACRFMNSFEQARLERISHPRAARSLMESEQSSEGDLPQMKYDHLIRMTDSTGILQHANFHLPNYREGYTTDDNARALTVSMMIEQTVDDPYINTDTLTSRYLAFLEYALNEKAGRFRNFLGFDHVWLESIGSEDSHGRALCSLGTVIGRSTSNGLRSLAGHLFEKALPAVYEMNHIRPAAFTLLGIYDYLRRFPGDRAIIHAGEVLSDRLVEQYHQTAASDWQWFEDQLTYSNATIPHALLLTSQWRNDPKMEQIGFQTLQWLVNLQTSPKGYFSFIGCKGFYPRDGIRASFDQQPIEAGTMVSACLEAYRMTGDRTWYGHAHRAFDWFLGKNDIGLPMYNPETGGCCDGLLSDRLNQNQGAESLLAFLQALLEIYQVDHISPVGKAKQPAHMGILRQRTFTKN